MGGTAMSEKLTGTPGSTSKCGPFKVDPGRDSQTNKTKGVQRVTKIVPKQAEATKNECYC